ncbi:MAG: FKBP-type peptidyl-prolyl cis-trans isomerase [Clostridia bacterium]|nr:FKBP-type peptidyl-prolyl cis-trans isomerase [Clostridia bacterium]
MKKIICIFLVLITVFSVCACSCIRGENKYEYEDMTEYIKLPNYKDHTYSVEVDSLKLAVGTYLMQYSSEYTVKRGDRINVDLNFYEILDPVVDIKGNEITELKSDDLWLENVATPTVDGGYQISYLIENNMIGLKIGAAAITRKLTLADDFYKEEYRGKEIFVDIKVNNVAVDVGDVLLASYTGYYIDADGKIVQENGKDKIFDESDSSSFYVGANLAIDEFEEGLIGMTIGVEKDIYATFPSEYEPAPELAGQRVLFRVKVKSLYTPPVYDDKFVTTYFSGIKTVAEFEEKLKEEYVLSLVYDYISENAHVIEYPKAEYKAALRQLIEIEGVFAENMNVTLDKYIEQEYGMTRDAYVKSNMKTEMIFYSLRNILGDAVIPTDTELKAERDALIAYYKNSYMQNDGLTETVATTEAKEFVDALGESYIYEQVLYSKIDKVIPTQVEIEMIPATKSYVFDAKAE